MGKIAVIDSGIGGLTVMKEMIHHFPQEELVYFGDQQNCPYGDKTATDIFHYVEQIITFLEQHPIKALVIACNTATSVVLPAIANRYPFPIIGVIEPGATLALRETHTERIGVMATQKTIDMHAYAHAIQVRRPNANVYEVACPQLVPLIEGDASEEAIHLALEECLFPLQSKGIDTLVLGCTHYPLISRLIQRIVGESVRLVNPAHETVAQLKKHVPLLPHTTQEPLYTFYTSGCPATFAKQAQHVLGFSVEAKQVILAEPTKLL